MSNKQRRAAEDQAKCDRVDHRLDSLLMVVGGGKELETVKPESAATWTDYPIGRGAFGEVWSVVDPRSGRRVALKRLVNIFSSLQFARRVLREIKCLSSFLHDNVLCATGILQLPPIDEFNSVMILTEQMDSDLHRIILSNQALSTTHIKVLLYQILRGLKYLHSGKIIHRDIKPANLLVNSCCSLKICDLGLVREDEVSSMMTQDVSTQYYRAPEMLMGAKHYTTSVDIWAVGCVFAEILSRRILFQSNTPIQQLDLIVEVVGTPQPEDMKFACEAARQHLLRQKMRLEPNFQLLQFLSSPKCFTKDALQLLEHLLAFNPDKRLTASKALLNDYVSQGRDYYHSTICSCHSRMARPLQPLQHVPDSISSPDSLEPVMEHPFSFNLDRESDDPSLITLIRNELHQMCWDKQKESQQLLRINVRSPAYKQFTGDTTEKQ